MGTDNIKKDMDMPKCSGKTEVYSRCVGFYRPVQEWNLGKKEEFADRNEYDLEIIDINLQKEKENV